MSSCANRMARSATRSPNAHMAARMVCWESVGLADRSISQHGGDGMGRGPWPLTMGPGVLKSWS